MDQITGKISAEIKQRRNETQLFKMAFKRFLRRKQQVKPRKFNKICTFTEFLPCALI